MPSSREPDADAPSPGVRLAAYPDRLERAGRGRPRSASEAYRLPDSAARSAAAAATSRRVLAEPAATPPAQAPAGPSPARADDPTALFPTGPNPSPARAHDPARTAAARRPHGPRHRRPAPWHHRVVLALLRLLRRGSD